MALLAAHAEHLRDDTRAGQELRRLAYGETFPRVTSSQDALVEVRLVDSPVASQPSQGVDLPPRCAALRVLQHEVALHPKLLPCQFHRKLCQRSALLAKPQDLGVTSGNLKIHQRAPEIAREGGDEAIRRQLFHCAPGPRAVPRLREVAA